MFNENPDRRIVPRWRDSLVTLGTGELAPLSARRLPQLSTTDFLASKLADWGENKTVSFATDLVGAAEVLGRTAEVRDAADFLLANRASSSNAALRLAKRVLNPRNELTHQGQSPHDEKVVTQLSRNAIRQLRGFLRNDPRIALAWTDMARHYAILGSNDQASDAIKRALALCPDNRFILRSATRFHVHTRNPDVAHDLLCREEKTKLDPWLLAAEIAAATVAGRTSRLVKRARQLMTKYPPFQITELASAIATLELNAGNNKAALKLFKQSLLEPTDNSIAQVEWASRRLKSLEVEPKHLKNPFSYEARAAALYLGGKWSESYRECLYWLEDEPYSSRPAMLGTFVTSVALEEYSYSEALARRSLRSNPNNQNLLNNLSFALASANKVEKAKEEYKLMNPNQFEKGDKISWLATGGLLLFRQGFAQEGRALYQQAIEEAKHDPDRRALAMLFLAREEILARRQQGRADYENAARTIQQVKSPGMVKILATALAKIKTQLEKQNERRSP